jgi:hypothetical protein
LLKLRNKASFLRRGVVNTSPNPQARGPPLVGCPRLLIQSIHIYPPYCRPYLHPQPEDVPCRGDRNPLIAGHACKQTEKPCSLRLFPPALKCCQNRFYLGKFLIAVSPSSPLLEHPQCISTEVTQRPVASLLNQNPQTPAHRNSVKTSTRF